MVTTLQVLGICALSPFAVLGVVASIALFAAALKAIF